MVRTLRQEYHLNDPFFTQYWIWLRNAVQFHFGNSIQTSLPVTDEIKTRLPVSGFLALYAYVLTVFFGALLGLGAALKRRTAVDRGLVATALVGASTPAFVSGVLMLFVFSVTLRWFPIFGRGQGFIDELWHLTLPAIAIAVVTTALIMKQFRASLINVLDQDYVVFARARGLSRRRILFVYAIRNALIPMVTVAAPLLAFLVTGAVFVEVVFDLPGVGSLLVQSAVSKDLPMLQGVGMTFAFLIMASNIVADVIYAFVDPRIRLGRSAG
jgi:peptide/nickel transport system permease protein